ncbi:MAG: NAD(P)-dependent oxidoreductase [Thermoanaerobaculia bacterium]
MPKRVHIAADVEPSLLALLRNDKRFDVTYKPVRDLTAIDAGCEILVTRTFNKVTDAVMNGAPHLRVIAQGTSGVDNIDLAAADKRGIRIISLPGINANAVAELVIGFIIALTRTVPAYNRQVVNAGWAREDCATRHELRHYRLGIAGLGQVGRRVARLAAAFGMQPAAVDPYITDADFAERGARRVQSFDELLMSSDILTMHVPLTPETNRMLGEAQLGKLPKGAIVINASRGEVIDQRAVLAALASNHLGGVALDVFDPEPPRTIFPDDPRLIVTPHIAGCSYECKNDAAAVLYQRLCDWLSSN